MSDEEMLNAIIKDLSFYFEHVREGDTAHNMNLARPLRERWGRTLIGMGLAWIVMDVRKFTDERIMLAFTIGEQQLDDMIQARMAVDLDCMHDLVSTFGPDASAFLGIVVEAATDEDTCALAAFMLASKQFSHPGVNLVLQEAFDRTEGTSCKLAIAFALYRCGDDKPIWSFIRAGYFLPKEILTLVEKSADEHARLNGLSRKERDALVVEDLVLSPNQRGGIVRILALDIGSDGKAYIRNTLGLPWKRKQYSD